MPVQSICSSACQILGWRQPAYLYGKLWVSGDLL